MADRNFANTDEPVLMAEDDPFAELTRIMGHDPRHPQARPTPLDEAVEDLALELENELMGDVITLEVVPDDAGQAGAQEPSGYVTYAGPQGFAEEAADEPAAPSDPGQDDPFVDLFEAEFESLDVERDEIAAPAPETLLQEAPSPEPEDETPAPEMERADMNAGEPVAGAPEDYSFEIRDEDLAALDSDFALPEAQQAAPLPDAEPDAGEADNVFAFDYARAASQRPDFLHDISSGETAPDAPMQDAPAQGAWQDDEPLLEDAAQSEPDAAWQQPDDEPESAPEGTPEGALESFDEWSPDKVFVSSSAEYQDWARAGDEPEPEAGESSAYGNLDDDAPEIETIEVPGEPVAVADALDVPEVPYRETVKSSAEFDEIDEMLSGAFGAIDEMAIEEAEAAAPPADTATPWSGGEAAHDDSAPADGDADFEFDFDDLARDGTQFSQASYQPAAADHAEPVYWADERAAPSLTPTPGAEPPPASGGSRFGSRGILVAALLGGVVLAGGVGVYAFGGGDGGSGEPVLIKADNAPIKVKPENPGGTTIPNQDNAVYKRVSGDSSDIEPAQKALVTTTEEPMDIAPKAAGVSDAGSPSLVAATATAEDTDASAKSDDRLVGDETGADPASGAQEIVALAPRRVRSLVVRPDGTMAPREMPEPVQNAGQSDGQSASRSADQSAGMSGGAADELTSAAETIRSAAQDSAAAGTAEAASGEAAGETQVAAAAVPRSAPIPPAKPANPAPARAQAAQPQQPGQEQAPATQASAPAAPAATVSAPWSVQISSQPSVEAAQQSYQDMAQRYGSILQGKGVNIVKADIAGKGTYFRVRIPSSSKDAAIQLCSQLKSAGGNCFVSK
ncbi:SPOR domain-containing protein [Nitratireductor thuwali]|uniref:SPOR domain-containing protein n=1 Tax=Nitratireductor thuwali TaxID=2267699 RepID=A0ABY5MPU6_9HYPH|nr:hypothetical protein NTH_03812 [Nitratireductor thuwali]